MYPEQPSPLFAAACRYGQAATAMPISLREIRSIPTPSLRQAPSQRRLLRGRFRGLWTSGRLHSMIRLLLIRRIVLGSGGTVGPSRSGGRGRVLHHCVGSCASPCRAPGSRGDDLGLGAGRGKLQSLSHISPATRGQ